MCLVLTICCFRVLCSTIWYPCQLLHFWCPVCQLFGVFLSIPPYWWVMVAPNKVTSWWECLVLTIWCFRVLFLHHLVSMSSAPAFGVQCVNCLVFSLHSTISVVSPNMVTSWWEWNVFGVDHLVFWCPLFGVLVSTGVHLECVRCWPFGVLVSTRGGCS